MRVSQYKSQCCAHHFLCCRTDVFQAADRLWEHFLHKAESCLSVPQFAVVIIGLAETAAALGEVWHNHQPGMRGGPYANETGNWQACIAETLDAANVSRRAMSVP